MARAVFRPLVPCWLTLLFVACSSTPKRLYYGALQSNAMGKPMQYAVYTSERPTTSPKPLVVFLHGGGDDVECFDEAGLGQHLDEALADGRIPDVVIAIPQGDYGFWENWADGTRRYRDWVMRELAPHVRSRYHTAACPDGCHVMGISMGGYGALRFAFLEPGAFASVTAISAPIFDTDQMLAFQDSFWWGIFVPTERIWGKPERKRVERSDLFLRWRTQADLHGSRLLVTWGNHDHDPIIATNEKFRAHMQAQKIDYETFVFDGGHDWESWTPVFERALRDQVGAPKR